jgi:nitroreductase
MTSQPTTNGNRPQVPPLSRSETQSLISAAGLAPSILNTQPWSFDAHDALLDVYADGDRMLHWSVDPHGRQLVISCGAALFNIRATAAHLGRNVTVQLLPDRLNPMLLARATFGPRGQAQSPDADLFAVIRRRHTHRRPFAPRRIPGLVLGELAEGVRMEHCTIVPVVRSQRPWLYDLVAFAEVALTESAGYEADLAKWTGGSTQRHDGVPVSAFGSLPTSGSPPMRDFGLGHMYAQPREHYSYDPWVAILGTAGDDTMAWLQAGQALQRLLLTATARGLAASFLNQPLDDPGIRRDLTCRSLGGHPQMILRLGYATGDVATPRRPIEDLARQRF